MVLDTTCLLALIGFCGCCRVGLESRTVVGRCWIEDVLDLQAFWPWSTGKGQGVLND